MRYGIGSIFLFSVARISMFFKMGMNGRRTTTKLCAKAGWLWRNYARYNGFKAIVCASLAMTITHCALASWPAALKDGDFFLYNKRSKPIYYALSIGRAELTHFTRISPQRCSAYIPVGVEKEVHVYLALDAEPKKGDTIDHYIFRPGTFHFIHLKVMSEPSDWHNVLRVDSEKEIIRDGYVLRMYTNYNPTIATTTRTWSARKDQPLIEHITYNGDQKQDRLEQLKAMTVDQLEERLSTITTLLGVLHARKNNDSEAACKQLEQERTWIRNLLAQHYTK